MIITPDPTRSITKENGIMQDVFRRWTVDVSRLAIIIGTGSPEGVVFGLKGQEYMDDTGTTGDIKYIKRDADIAGDRTSGWILI